MSPTLADGHVLALANLLVPSSTSPESCTVHACNWDHSPSIQSAIQGSPKHFIGYQASTPASHSLARSLLEVSGAATSSTLPVTYVFSPLESAQCDSKQFFLRSVHPPGRASSLSPSHPLWLFSSTHRCPPYIALQVANSPIASSLSFDHPPLFFVLSSTKCCASLLEVS